MSILITGATGHLGRLVISELLARGTAPGEIIAGARSPEKGADLADLGVRLVALDYSDRTSVDAAISEAESVLLISGSEPGARLEGHRNVIQSAAEAGVAKFVYTSAPKVSEIDWALGADHRATEAAIAESGIPAVILRDNWYTENYTADVLRADETGVITAAAGDGRVASASRADYAAGLATVLLEEGHLGKIYEVGGDVAWNYDELAAAAGEVLGREVRYERVTPEQLTAALQEQGLPEGVAQFVAGIDEAIAAGVLGDTDGTLARLIGRPTTPLVEGLRAEVAAARAAQ